MRTVHPWRSLFESAFPRMSALVPSMGVAAMSAPPRIAGAEILDLGHSTFDRQTHRNFRLRYDDGAEFECTLRTPVVAEEKPPALASDGVLVDGDGAIDLTIGGLMISVEIHKGDSVREIVQALLAKLESR